ncbi:MAG TPA: DUF2505 domain-containing protein [Actinomycetota bacterium]|nr:DUF2505 domain-containing protein [Actinomycetota bacterium]
MDFDKSDAFDAPLEKVAAILLDLDFQSSLDGLEPLSERTILSQEESPDGHIVRRTRCVLDIEISGVARTFLGDAKPAWVEEAIWHPADHRWEWTIHPEVAKDLFEASGTIELTTVGTQTHRRVSGSVAVSVPIYGGRVEGWIIDGIKHAYEEEARRLREWLEREKPEA